MLRGQANGNIGVATKAALLHVAVRNPHMAQDAPQGLQVMVSLLARAQIRLGDDLQKTDPRPVQVHIRTLDPALPAVQQLARILFHMNAFQTDNAVFRIALFPKTNLAADGIGLVILGNLVSLGQIRIEIMFAIELGEPGDLALQSQPRKDRQTQHLGIEHRQNPGKPQGHRPGLRVGTLPIPVRVRRKDLAFGFQLAMDFQSDHSFIFSHRGKFPVSFPQATNLFLISTAPFATWLCD